MEHLAYFWQLYLKGFNLFVDQAFIGELFEKNRMIGCDDLSQYHVKLGLLVLSMSKLNSSNFIWESLVYMPNF
jgi:hypothetical protein